MLAKLTGKNQITIPKKILSQLEDVKYFDVDLKDGLVKGVVGSKTTYGINLHSLNLAACGGIFLDRINKIFLYSLYPEHPVYPA